MNTRIFIDTNILIDLLGERIPFYDSAAKIASLADNNKIKLIVSSLSVSTVYYILRKYENDSAVRNKLRKLKTISQIAAIDEKIISQGLDSAFSDFEDSLQYYCAIENDCIVLITRNAKDYQKSLIPVYAPDEYLSVLKSK